MGTHDTDLILDSTMSLFASELEGMVLSQVQRTKTRSFAYDDSADICDGQWTLPSGKILTVTLKSVRGNLQNDKPEVNCVIKRFLREAHLRRQLHHPNVSELHGLYLEEGYPVLVMPHYKNGNILQFMRTHSGVNKLDMISQAAAGLEYLHNLKDPVILGRIQASSIMVTDNHQACLADFGVAKTASVSGYTTASLDDSYRWMAPEILEDDGISPTLKSDIWAFVMTILQIYTDKAPFHYVRMSETVVRNLLRGDLPRQPPEINDTIWALLKEFLKSEPTNRPPASALSIALDILASQDLTTGHMKALVDSLGHHAPCFDGLRMKNRPRHLRQLSSKTPTHTTVSG